MPLAQGGGRAPVLHSGIVVCSAIYRRPRYHFMKALAALKKPPGTKMSNSFGAQLDQARELFTKQLLELSPAPSHTLWVDEDADFAPDALERLLRVQLPIVGGLCFSKQAPYYPILMKGGVMAGRYPTGALVEVDACSAAFLLIETFVFRTLAKKVPVEDIWRDGAFGFCAHARAADFPINVHCGVRIGRVTDIVVDEGLHDAFMAADKGSTL